MTGSSPITVATTTQRAAMRCPSCGDDYEPEVERCVECRVALYDPDDPDAAPPPDLPVTTEARLGRFHPLVAPQVVALLQRRGVAHRTVEHDDDVEVFVDGGWRDDLRAELTLSWSELVRRLDDVPTRAVLGGGPTPGWIDGPRGGHVDRAGRLVVDAEQDDLEADASRMLGPGMVASGAVLALFGWLLVDAPALVIAGAILALVGVLTPR